MLDKVKGIEDLDVESRATFVRVDFNVPLTDDQQVADDTRIQAALPTINALRERGARVVLCSHLGRPKGKRVPELSLEPVGLHLAKLIEDEVYLTEDTVGDGPRKVVRDLRDGQVALLENVRFQAEETDNDEAFARQLADLADVYVNDAFGAAHRAHASTAGMAAHVREKGAGLLMKRELESLGKLLGDVDRPFVAILGGAKVSDKIGVIESLLSKVDSLLIGGAMANTFLAAQGMEMGSSKIEEDRLPLAREILRKAEEAKVKLFLPEDVVVAEGLDSAAGREVACRDVPEGQMALDIGSKSRAAYAAEADRAATIFWNGPMGVFEKEPFAGGTLAVCRAVANAPAFSVVGGGDSVAAVRRTGLHTRFGHVSTGGGASLKLIEGKELPGVAALLSPEANT